MGQRQARWRLWDLRSPDRSLQFGAARSNAGKVACGRLAATAPHLRALATIVAPEQLWSLCRKELQGRDLDVYGWIIKPCWFGIVVVSTGRHGAFTGPSTIEWRTFAEHLAGRRS